MLKLPVCPHCNTIYRYNDVSKIMNKKSVVCYHCKKNFKIKRKNILILFLIIALICAIFDVLELYLGVSVNFIALVVTNVVLICVGLILRPYFVKFSGSDRFDYLLIKH